MVRRVARGRAAAKDDQVELLTHASANCLLFSRRRYSRRVGEEKLVESLRAGDEDAFRRLVREYQPSLVRVARIYVPTQAAAEEVAAETWLAVLNGLDRFEGRSSLRTWIFRILTNIAKTRAVRDGRTLPFSALDPGRVPEAAVDADRFLDPEHPRWPGHWAVKPEAWPEDALLAAETRDRLAEAIEALPATQRAVISLRDIEGWSSEEVRNALDLSETNQRVLLHRARSKVRAALEDYLK
jgi:RNA polymerase sigma-70 factor (ECF subfamily)